MHPEGFEPAIPAGDRPQNLALDGSATGIALHVTIHFNKYTKFILQLLYSEYFMQSGDLPLSTHKFSSIPPARHL
jgi:hypothetical protein